MTHAEDAATAAWLTRIATLEDLGSCAKCVASGRQASDVRTYLSPHYLQASHRATRVVGTPHQSDPRRTSARATKGGTASCAQRVTDFPSSSTTRPRSAQ
jgi:hypothetical protein